MKNFKVYLFTCCCLIFGCRETSVEQIRSIQINSGNCFGSCQVTACLIDSILRFQYFGQNMRDYDPRHFPGQPKKIQGYFTGKIGQGTFDSLNNLLSQISFKNLNDVYPVANDAPPWEIFIHHKGRCKHIIGTNFPSELERLITKLKSQYAKIKLKKIGTLSNFESSFVPLRPTLPIPVHN